MGRAVLERCTHAWDAYRSPKRAANAMVGLAFHLSACSTRNVCSMWLGMRYEAFMYTEFQHT